MPARWSVPLRWSRLLAGLFLGALTAPIELVCLAAAGLAIAGSAAWPRSRRGTVRRVLTVAGRVAALERSRVAAFFGERTDAPHRDRRAVPYLALRVLSGLLGGMVLGLFGAGVDTGVTGAWAWARGSRPDGIPASGWIIAYILLAGTVLAFLAVQGLVGVANIERRLVRWLTRPSARDAFERRISELAISRADVVAAVDDERRRIERDLHDGVQQRLVALGMLVGRARRAGQPERVSALLAQAHEQSWLALNELREVAWRVYPVALDGGGLRAALETVAERSSVPVDIEFELAATPGRAVDAAIYFVVCEAVTNAAKHANASAVRVRVARVGDTIAVSVHDDGSGGADPGGGGLTGLARRVAALDGRLRVDSPAGGPTTIMAELPCG
jgi:signal transduction histidine kinase